MVTGSGIGTPFSFGRYSRKGKRSFGPTSNLSANRHLRLFVVCGAFFLVICFVGFGRSAEQLPAQPGQEIGSIALPFNGDHGGRETLSVADLVLKDEEAAGFQDSYPKYEIDDATKPEELDDVAEARMDAAAAQTAAEAAEAAANEPDAPLLGATAVVVDELGGFMFSDGALYEQAPQISVEVGARNGVRTKRSEWGLRDLHNEFFDKHSHRLYIPRLAQAISREEFHQTFRLTSTPVIIPFEYMRHLGVDAKGWTIEEMKERFPYAPPKPGIKKKKKVYRPGDGSKEGLDLGPALYALGEDANLDKSTKGQRNFPRNMMIKSKYLTLMGVSRPPFVHKKRFQTPTVWMGTSTSDTKLHHDCCDNFVMMIAGTKRWFIAPPTEYNTLSPVRCDGTHNSLCWAAVKYPNEANPKPQDAEKLKQLQSLRVDLKAGEMLYLPAGWWHHIENLGPTVMVNFWTTRCDNVAIQLENDPQVFAQSTTTLYFRRS